MIFKVAKQSLLNRKVSVLMTFLALLVSVSLLISIEHIRKEAKNSFYRTVSGVDLIVGARTGQINLLLSSVFRVGANPNSVSWESYQRIIANNKVEWAIPLSLGDSHKGFAVIGTNNDYFKHYKYGNKRQLIFQLGGQFGSAAGLNSAAGFDVVLGADAAKKLNYAVGDDIIISHGVGKVSFSHHNDHPLTVVGILAFTGTPVDQAIHVTLSAIESVHTRPQSPSFKRSLKKANTKPLIPGEPGVEDGYHSHNLQETHLHQGHSDSQHGREHNDITMIQADNKNSELSENSHEYTTVKPTQVSAFMLGLKSRIAVLQLQRQINQDKNEPLSAIIPGVALAELWRLVSSVENVLRIISLSVLVASLLGLSTMLLASLRERRAEINIFRIMGAKPSFVFWLIQLEALSISLASSLFALISVAGIILLSRDWLLAEYGLSLSVNVLSWHTALVVITVCVATFIIALVPSISAYRNARILN